MRSSPPAIRRAHAPDVLGTRELDHIAALRWDAQQMCLDGAEAVAILAADPHARKPQTLDGARRDLQAGGDLAFRQPCLEYAASEAADLIVVGSSHRGKVGRVLPGSVGESLLRGGPCAVAPRGFPRGDHAGFGLIGVGYDGSPQSKLALVQAEALARVLDCRLRVITVVPELEPLTVQIPNLGEIRESMRKGYRNSLEAGVATVGKGIDVEPVLIEGDPAAALADQGVELDLIVIGSRGYGPLRGALAGAVSTAVMRTAPCLVLVTPRASAD